jgi:hypothetical protein
VIAETIFVLFLIVVFVGSVVALSLHSRRQETATGSSEAPPVAAAAETSEPQEGKWRAGRISPVAWPSGTYRGISVAALGPGSNGPQDHQSE